MPSKASAITSSSTIGLVDGNNFYASCERVFQPQLMGKPVVVLSNNDGCAIARSQEAKALGIKMGQPIHEVPDEVRRQCVIRSANFGLYGDISGRIVEILRDLFPRVEVYSIDESFVSFEGIKDPMAAARDARARIRQWVGIPSCVGLGPTKTLAKMANKIAKGGAQVVDLSDPIERGHRLENFPVEDLWGVGRRWAARLGAEGILTAAGLARADAETLRARYGVVLARTQLELRGVPSSDLIEEEPDRQQIVCSRSFGKECSDLDDVLQAASTFAIRACEKLRARSLQCGGVWVWLNTNPFKAGAKQYHPSKAMPLIMATSDTREVLAMVHALVRTMYRKGYRYKKAGVGLLDLTAGSSSQGDLFAGIDPRSQALMDVLDKTNRKFGRGTMGFGASGWKPKPVWAMNQQSLSPRYTSSWKELLRVQ
jgi:DNA polymerase V